MEFEFSKTRLSLAVAAALGAGAFGAVVVAPQLAVAAKTPGTYVAGDFHNHTTCSDGSISMQKLVKKSTDKLDTPWGLDWFVQAGHGGNGNRNCTLVEDASLATPEYPYDPAKGPNTTWTAYGVTPKGAVSGTTNRNMWRWQSLQEVQYQVIEYLNELKNLPLFLGLESVVAGHEHASMSVITGQIPVPPETGVPLSVPGYVPFNYIARGNASALAQWEYCFDRNDTDTSRGNTTTTSGIGNNWDCTNPNSPNSTFGSTIGWNDAAKKLVPTSGGGVGDRGHQKTVEALKWMKDFHPNASYYAPAHLERAGPFNPDGNNGYNVEHLRNFNNAAPRVAFGMETQPGHGASSERGEYFPGRNSIGGVSVDSVGGTTYGGTGVYGAQIGGVWDALLGEGRNFWFFASSDWHNRGSFGADDRRSTQDFFPGEYQRNYTMVRNGSEPKLRPQMIVDGLRTGNNWAASGQLIDRLALVACASYPGIARRTNAAVEAIALNAAVSKTDVDVSGCATMGEKLVVRPGAEIVVSVVVRDPAGTNYSPYSFPNPSLAQIFVTQPLNAPVLDHIDLIGGSVTGYKTPGSADYAGQWPNNWLATVLASGPDLGIVPAAAKNLSASILQTFNGQGGVAGKTQWTAVGGADGTTYLKMTFRIPAVQASQYVRLRGTNLPPSVPYETDSQGNPLPDVHTNATTTNVAGGIVGTLKIKCDTTTGSNVPANGTLYPAGSPPIDACPNHLPSIAGQKYVAYDVAAWSDLWFYSNPIYIQVNNSTPVAGVN